MMDRATSAGTLLVPSDEWVEGLPWRVPVDEAGPWWVQPSQIGVRTHFFRHTTRQDVFILLGRVTDDWGIRWSIVIEPRCGQLVAVRDSRDWREVRSG